MSGGHILPIRSLCEVVPEPRRDIAYELAAALQPKLCVDVGAAAGAATRRMLQSAGMSTRVVAFEPFPGNHRFFELATTGWDNVRLVRKAVSDRCGYADLVVSSVVAGVEKEWEEFAGYSSVGYIPASRIARLRLRLRAALARARQSRCAQRIRVETTTLDSEFPSERIHFLKIDVQGAERLVLRGGQKLLSDCRAEFLYLEWFGDPVVERILRRYEFEIFDSIFVGGGDRVMFERLGFEPIGQIGLSTGASALEMVRREARGDLGSVMRRINRLRGSWIQTDLIAIRGRAAEAIHSQLAVHGVRMPTGT